MYVGKLKKLKFLHLCMNFIEECILFKVLRNLHYLKKIEIDSPVRTKVSKISRNNSIIYKI